MAWIIRINRPIRLSLLHLVQGPSEGQVLFLSLLKKPSLWLPYLLTYKLVSCFLSRDLIALVLPESKTQETADLRGQQLGTPVSGTPRLWNKPALGSFPQAPRDPGLSCHCYSPVLGTSPRCPVPTSLLWACISSPAFSPRLWSPPHPGFQPHDSPYPSSQVS